MGGKGMRRGTALIEALVATALLGIVGTSLLLLLGQAHQTLRVVGRAEAVVDSASAELDGLVVLDRDAVLQRVGWTIRGGLALHVEQVTSSLFDVGIARQPGGAALLRTTLYRPRLDDAR